MGQREDVSMKSFLLRCQINRSPVEIMYIANSGKISQRIITVGEISESTIKAYCHLRKMQRVFKIKNILAINCKNAAG
jgi:predicted DNA-binding transcriptional regulator YafY